MATTTTLRPSATSSGIGWTPSTGTLHGVTSDDSDATYATWSGSGSPLILATPVDSPPAGERRHAVRMRARGEDGDAWWAVRLSSGALVAGAAAQFTASPGTITGSWGFGAPPDGSTVLYTYVTGQSTGLRIEELYIDMDSRLAPTLTPEVLDGSGTSTTTVSDTNQPVVRASSIDLDDLNARQYRYWVTLDGAIVWDTGVVSGASVNRQTVPLDNGSYVAHVQIWSTLGSNTAYASDEETLAFTVSVGLVPAPDNPTVDPLDGTPFYTVTACAPYVGDFDDEVGYVEVQRVDCPLGGYLLMTGSAGEYASTPDPGPTLTDLQVTVYAQRDDDWFPANEQTLAAHYDSGSNQRSWRLNIGTNGFMLLGWSTDGTSGGTTFAEATARPPIDPFGAVRLRVRLDVDDGAGGWTVTYETQEDEDSPWVQLGDVLSNGGAGTTSIFDSSADYTVGTFFLGGVPSEIYSGKIYSVEIRDGSAGSILASPDFTGYMSGTTSFTDAQANVWEIHSPAAIVNPVTTTTLAMLGPLATDECADWIDFTLPRSGSSDTCDHEPEACCSYYRARTVGRVDGDLRISDWSDGFNPAIPLGLIVMWPSTNASIPDGWERVTELDGKYPKGVATSSTDPGATGGAASHSHTVPTHLHDTSHTHTHTGATSAGVGALNSTPNSAGATAVLTTHTHTRPTTSSATVSSGATAPTSDANNNDPARLDVIFVQSDGTPLGVPDGALGMMPDISVSGWTDFTDATNRFLKGAAAAGNGGATAVSALDNHNHSVDAHTHTGTSHTHTATSGNAASANTLTAGAQAVLWQASHSHLITAASTSTQSLASGGSGTSGDSAGNDPPYRNIRVKENTLGVPDLPVGLVCAWRGSLGSIPNFWQLCDGTNGTLDMTGIFPRGATASIGSTGGSLSPHDHTTPSHNHTTTGHAHTETIGSAGAATSGVSTTSTVSVSTGTHTHTGTNTDSTTPTVSSVTSGTLASTTQEPPYEEVAFVQLMETPTPPPVPSLFCLEWDDDRHLIRTLGPSGPLWANVGGKFDWDVDRPFTAASGVMGSRFVTSAEPGARNLHMTAAVESEDELATLHAVLERPLVLISPSDSEEVWAAPVAESVRVIKIGRIRQVTADFIGTGPQPPPQLADVGV
jgi:hypothetical protein